MAKNDSKNDANATDKSDGTDRTSALNDTAAPAPSSRANLDPESDAGKAAASDKAHSGGAIRAEDNTEAGPGQPAEAAPAGTDPSVSEKITVKTTGTFMLQDPYSLDTMTQEPTEVVRTSFVNDRLAAGQLVEA